MTQIGRVHEANAMTIQLPDGRYAGYVEHRIYGGRQPEAEMIQAGTFDTEAEAFAAALDLSRKFEPRSKTIHSATTHDGTH